jgi:hypothetical protein
MIKDEFSDAVQDISSEKPTDNIFNPSQDKQLTKIPGSEIQKYLKISASKIKVCRIRKSYSFVKSGT